jgi:hypothetical protein
MVISYIAFLFRYFNVCDSNQIQLLSHFLLASIGNGSNTLPNGFHDHSVRLHGILMNTYGKSKQAAAGRVFNGNPSAHDGYCAEPIPSEETRYPNLPGTLGAYDLAVTLKGVPLFDMGNGPHLALLPQTVLLFYAYVVDNLEDAAQKEKLDELIRKQIASHSRWDPTTSATMAQGTRMLMKSLGLAGSVVSVSNDGDISF